MKIVIEEGKAKRFPTITGEGIYGFFPPYRYLSNFHITNIIMPDGLTYPSTENAFQAYKVLDLESRKPFTTCSCGEAKAMGRKVKLRPDWEEVKISIMKSCLEAKFKDNDLMEMLKSTAPKYLEETNNWGDKFWGVENGVGENMLGKLLMEIRDDKC